MAGERMIVPPHSAVSSEVDADWQDVRVPAPVDPEWPARVAGYYLRKYWSDQDEPCERHLFDVVEARSVRYDEDEHELLDFRARLTCVRCGRVYAWEGTRTRDEEIARLDPAPLTAGPLRAQQIEVGGSYSRDMSSWTVYDAAGERVGVITWACGPRGRAYHRGLLNAWPADRSVDGSSPLAVLRSLARGFAAPSQASTPEPITLSHS